MTHFEYLERYHRWFNIQLYDACATLTDHQRKSDQGAYFTSIHGTLNHLLLAQKIWLGRFVGEPFVFDDLNQELHQDFEALRADQVATDQQFREWLLESLPLEGQRLEFVNSFGDAMSLDYVQAAAHVFNHATHHRGQVTTLLFQQGVDVGITDLARMPADFT